MGDGEEKSSPVLSTIAFTDVSRYVMMGRDEINEKNFYMLVRATRHKVTEMTHDTVSIIESKCTACNHNITFTYKCIPFFMGLYCWDDTVYHSDGSYNHVENSSISLDGIQNRLKSNLWFICERLRVMV